LLLDRDGALEAGDLRGATSLLDRYEVPVSAGDHVRVVLTSTAFDPLLEVTLPEGQTLTNDDVRGDRTRSEIELVITSSGSLKVQVESFQPDAQGPYHLRIERVRTPTPPSSSVAAGTPLRRHHVTAMLAVRSGAEATAAGAGAWRPMPIRVGDRVAGDIAAGDFQLESGEFADVYLLDLAAPTDVTIQMQSSRVDSFLMVIGPDGARWENDDSGGTRDATVEIPGAAPGSYRIVATTYRAGEVGAYELKVVGGRDPRAIAGTDRATSPSGEQILAGSLAPGDRSLSSGEFFDEHSFSWPVGAPVHLEARSTEFDTYLILRMPSGAQRDNDDQAPGVRNAALDFVVQEAGPHRVLVTSYRPGERGRYELVVRTGGAAGTAMPPPTSAPAPPPVAASAGGEQMISGRLQPGDRTLASGEWMDLHTLRFTPGMPVSVRLESSEFDPYLIVRSPSGRQEDNDDLRPGVLNSGIDIPSAEPGEYQIVVTSYRPGESGSYTLRIRSPAGGEGSSPSDRGTSSASASSGGGSIAAIEAPGAGGSRVWLLSVGITDYPPGTRDLPDCANDAVKIAEALRIQGLTTPEREFLFTDAQATRANIVQALRRLASQVRPEDTFVFFYSGHGGQSEVPSPDSRELDGVDEFLAVYDGPLTDDELGRLVSEVHARTTLAAIDACHAGGFAKDLITRPGIVGLFSSEEDVTSAVASEFQAGGYLSHFLRLGIQGEADNDPRDRVMTVGELTHYVWQQYGWHAGNVRIDDSFQHLVVDRGAVRASQELWRTAR
jgi:hypothetical protein